MITSIDNGYAAVLFDLGKQNNKLQNYFEWANDLLILFEQNQSFCQLLANTSIDKDERKKMINDIFNQTLDETFIYFLWTLIDFNRARDLIGVIKLFLKLTQQYYGISYVQVTSAYPLSKDELTALESALKQGMNLTKVTINNEIDSTLIGGVKLKTHAISIDDTIRSKLNKMRESSFKQAQKGE